MSNVIAISLVRCLYVYAQDIKPITYVYAHPPVAVPSMISTIAHTGTKNCPSMRNDTLIWPSLSATVKLSSLKFTTTAKQFMKIDRKVGNCHLEQCTANKSVVCAVIVYNSMLLLHNHWTTHNHHLWSEWRRCWVLPLWHSSYLQSQGRN